MTTLRPERGIPDRVSEELPIGAEALVVAPHVEHMEPRDLPLCRPRDRVVAELVEDLALRGLQDLLLERIGLREFPRPVNLLQLIL